ncbi:hypothetical protein pdam_00008134 [Pocillopora damicornis]|uniref:Major facilitator superfamily (MFS) profile domain-containing protein n=1 Tax=Pocillopora damicornis TaxID=46731 RepID=A0A3M6UDL5_POCDA|nr:hypothetical protein pdam_00008134 [Pocillopora damicornis]
MAENGVELELKDVAVTRSEKLSSPSTQRPNYESLKEHNDNNENVEQTFTLSEAVETIGMGKFQILLILMAGFVNMCDSLELLLLAVLSPTIHCLWHLSSWEEAFITTIVFVGMSVGCPVWGWLSDNLGRKSMIIISASWLCYFGFISSFSPHYFWLVALRCLFFWALGSTFMVVVALIVMPTLGWRWMTAFATVPVIIFIILCRWLPESPRYLITAGEKEKGMEVLERMARINGSKLPPGTLKIETQTVERVKIQVLFNSEYRLTTLLLWLTFFTSGFLYYGVVLMSAQVLQQVRPDESICDLESLSTTTTECGCQLLTVNDYMNLLWTTVAEYPGILFTMLFMERLGRKKTLAVEFFIIAACLGLMFICTGRTLLLVLLFLARGMSLGVFQGFFVYAPEVYPTVIRSLGFGFCSTWARFGGMLTPYIAQVLLRVSWNLSLVVYISLSMMSLVATLLLPYETKGRPMQEM